jgi:hypothetical protein
MGSPRFESQLTCMERIELLLQNEYLAAENGILRAPLPNLRLSDGERSTLAEIGKRLGPSGSLGGCSRSHGLHAGHGAPAPPQLQSSGREDASPHGR